MDFSGDFNSEYSFIEGQDVAQTLEDTMDELLAEDYYSAAPVQASTPVKQSPVSQRWQQSVGKYSAVNQLSSTLPYYRRYEESPLNSTVPDEENHRGGYIEPLSQNVLNKLKAIKKKIAMKQQEIEQIYLENAKVSSAISDANKEVQVSEQVLKQKKRVRFDFGDLNESMKSQSTDLDMKIDLIQSENKNMKSIDSLPAAQKDQARKCETKQSRIQQKDYKIQQLEKKLNILKNNKPEDTREDEKLAELENELFLVFEKISKHQENTKDITSAMVKSCRASGANTKQMCDSTDAIKAATQAVVVLELRIAESSIIYHKHMGVFAKSHPNTDEMIRTLEGLIAQNLCWKRKCEVVQSEANKTTEKLANIKRNFKPQGYEIGEMEQLKDANSKKTNLIKDIRSLRALVSNCKLTLKEVSARKDVKTTKMGLKKLDQEIARCEKKQFKKTDDETKAVKGDYNCDANALKWASASASA